MAKIAKRTSAKAEPSSGRRISIDEALQNLFTVAPPHAAAEILNAALRENRVRLWCNGRLLSPNYIRRELVVQAVPEADGRWCAQIVPIRSAWEDKAYRWQVDEAGVRALLRSPVRRKPGPKPTGDWPMEVARWLIMVARKHPDALENISQLVRDAREFLQKQGLFAPQEDKDLRRVIQRLLEL